VYIKNSRVKFSSDSQCFSLPIFHTIQYIKQWILAQISYVGLALDSLDLASTVGGVEISILEVTGVVAKGVDVFFPVGVSLLPQGELVEPTIIVQ